ncbi:MAG: peptide chain release factor N(5)-glutamine methyltransferase [Pseudomonadota bacterium]|jgi:release factor glutamine methyltransferase|nr:peptide chain release factor N(5)-glutamine methyltransferase [Pseudomonadota bacterium]
MTTLAELLRRAPEAANLSDRPEQELRILAGAATGWNPTAFYTAPERCLNTAQLHRFEGLWNRRLQGEPIAYLLGEQGFWSLLLEVTPDTLVPRPETERLVELALELLPAGHCRVADLGTGSGAIALALATERPAWQLVATDRSEPALKVAARNRDRHRLSQVELRHGDWCTALGIGRFDAVLSNPPYVAPQDPHLGGPGVCFEPRSALVAGNDGMADLAALIDQSPVHLNPGGWLLLEHGCQQAAQVRTGLSARGFVGVCTHQDLAGQDRVTLGRWPGGRP